MRRKIRYDRLIRYPVHELFTAYPSTESYNVILRLKHTLFFVEEDSFGALEFVDKPTNIDIIIFISSRYHYFRRMFMVKVKGGMHLLIPAFSIVPTVLSAFTFYEKSKNKCREGSF